MNLFLITGFKRIILQNKEKVYFFVNVKSDKIFEKMVKLHVILFLSYKQELLKTIDIIYHNNDYFLIAKLLDDFFLLKYMTNNFIFNKKLDCTNILNNILYIYFPIFFILKLLIS